MGKDLTQGGVLKTLAFFSLPFLLSYFLQTFYGLADLFIIGQFEGVSGTTAVAIGSQIMHMLTVMITGLAMGTTVTIARACGGKDAQAAARAIGATTALFAAVSILLTLLLLVEVENIIRLVATPAAATAETCRYLAICFAGMPCITAYNVISAVMRGLGDSKSPLYFTAVACVANIALDYFFIGALQLGAAGAALGTVVAQTLSVAWALVFICRTKALPPAMRRDFTPSLKASVAILKIGVPLTFQEGLIQTAFIVITVIANLRGLNDAAAVGIAEKIISFVFLVPSSLLAAVAAICAQNIGAGKPLRAKETLRYAVYLATAFGLVVALPMQGVAGRIIALFTNPTLPGGSEVIRLGGEYLQGYSWDTIFAGIHFSFSGYFYALARADISFLHNFISIVLLRVPGVYLASVMFPDTLLPMGLATASGSLLSVGICLTAYKILAKRETLS